MVSGFSVLPAGSVCVLSTLAGTLQIFSSRPDKKKPLRYEVVFLCVVLKIKGFIGAKIITTLKK